MKRYSYKITGLECANCALRVETALNKEKDFKNVSVNFASSKISYETDLENHFKKINSLLKEIEPKEELSCFSFINSCFIWNFRFYFKV